MMMDTGLDRFLPMRVSGVRPGYGSFFTIDLDASTGARRYLWIYLCGWAILNGEDGTMCSNSSKIEIDNFLSKDWKPSKLLSAEINNKSEIDFKFDNSQLRLFPYPQTYGEDADIFRFFEDDKMHYWRLRDKQIKEIRKDREGRVNIDR